MEFQTKLIDGKLIKRYKRFLSDVDLGSENIVVAHVPNSGSMIGVNEPGSPCRVSLSSNPMRKLPHTLEMVQEKGGSWVGVNTSLTNKLVAEAFEKKKIKDWHQFTEIKAEVKINKETRLDFLLSNSSKKRYVEVKNVSMAYPPHAVFPDAVTERGQKHLRELAKLASEGFETEILFVVQREDCQVFRPCDEIDPAYGALLRKVAKEGVNIRCWSCRVTHSNIELDHEIPIVLNI